MTGKTSATATPCSPEGAMDTTMVRAQRDELKRARNLVDSDGSIGDMYTPGHVLGQVMQSLLVLPR